MQMQREKMVGENLREAGLEVAYEHWFEHSPKRRVSRHQRFSTVIWKTYRIEFIAPVRISAERNVLNLGGTTDACPP